jgi:ABC-2 type transport system permease protein
VTAKFLHSYLIGLLGVVLASIVVVIIFRPGWINLAAAAGLALIANVLLTAIGMMIDLARPLLDWTNPQKAMKQNLNILLAMLVDASILTASYFGVKALMKAGVTGNLIVGLLFAVFAGAGSLACLCLLKFAGKRYREIEG